MDRFDYSNLAHRKARMYRTHAFTAQLFADSPIHRSNTDTWAYIADAWTELAGIKERSNQTPAPAWPNR